MKQTLSVVVKVNAKHETIEKRADGSYLISVKAPPLEGKANQAVIKALAHYFSVPQSSVRIASGLKGKKKIIKIE